jgi:phosphoethanolamine N-methyltransferase
MSTNQVDQPGEENFYPKSELPFFEKIWGKGFVSPGGPTEVAKILKGVELENKRILDIGCGMGGIDILLVEKYGAAEVIGIDVEKPVLEKAERYALEAGVAEKIDFILVEPGPLRFENDSFDIVFSKDALLHISDKSMLFSEIFRVLKPGGVFVGGDWLRGEYDIPSEQMKMFFELTHNEFNMVTLREYERKLADAGFSGISLLNRNEWYQGVVKAELKKILSLKEEIVDAVGLETYQDGWESFWIVLVETLKSGEFCPAHFHAIKKA